MAANIEMGPKDVLAVGGLVLLAFVFGALWEPLAGVGVLAGFMAALGVER